MSGSSEVSGFMTLSYIGVKRPLSVRAGCARFTGRTPALQDAKTGIFDWKSREFSRSIWPL